MSGSWPITWWEDTGKHGEFVQGVSSPIYRNIKTGETTEKLPFGACFVSNIDRETKQVRPTRYVGADGLSIVCICPNTEPPDLNDSGYWYIDSRASNCTMKDDDVHRCWVRHGTVGDALTVDKDGVTCKAGAGSIQHRDWHGFLQNGVLHS